MKLITKFLTVLTPITVMSATVPTVVSCSCSKDDYLFSYGDDINCRDKKDKNYHSLEDVQKAARVRAPKSEKRTFTLAEINDINAGLQQLDDHGRSYYYYDFVASITITLNEEINLKNWTVQPSKVMPVADWYSFNLNGTDYPKNQGTEPNFSYGSASPDDKTIYLFYRSGTAEELTYKSYIFSDCQLA